MTRFEVGDRVFMGIQGADGHENPRPATIVHVQFGRRDASETRYTVAFQSGHVQTEVLPSSLQRTDRDAWEREIAERQHDARSYEQGIKRMRAKIARAEKALAALPKEPKP